MTISTLLVLQTSILLAKSDPVSVLKHWYENVANDKILCGDSDGSWTDFGNVLSVVDCKDEGAIWQYNFKVRS